MKSLLIVLSLTIASHSMASDIKLESESKMKGCITSVYKAAALSSSPSKDVLKAVSTGVKECRQTVSALKKKEREAKKAASKAKRIAKLKEQLAKLTK